MKHAVAIACLVVFQAATTTHAQLGDGDLVAWWTFENGEGKEVYPQWWGARADRKTDDTAAIQAAINSYTRGGRVFFVDGTYVVSRTIEVRGGTRLIGDGAVLRGVVDMMLRGTDISVCSSGWRLRGIALDGLANASEQEAAYAATLDLTRYGIDTSKARELTQITPQGEVTKVEENTTGAITLRGKLAGRGLTMYRLQ